MNVELELISNIVDRGDFSVVRKKGITPDTFNTEEARTVFRWLWDEFHSPAHPGEVPDKDRLRRKFPNFDYRPTRNSIEAITLDVLSNKMRNELQLITLEVEELLAAGEDPFLVLTAFLPRMRDLNSSSADTDGLLMASSAALLRQEYETKNLAGGITGIPYPWDPLNVATCGMQPEELLVLYGRPKNMKSWLALAMAVHAYESNRRVLVYSKEMSKEQTLRRAASILCKIDYELLRTGNLHPQKAQEFFEFLEDLVNLENMAQNGQRKRSLMFVGDADKKGGTVDSLAAKAERFGADLVVADAFYLMRDGRTNTRTADWKNIAHISQDLKLMARALKIPVLGTTQANRNANASHGDDLSELAGSDAIGQDADLVMRCFRGRGPTGRSAVMLTFPGIREAQLNPFLVNAVPGTDFSLLQNSVDVAAFLKDKRAMDQEDENKNPNGAAPGGRPAQGQKRPPRTPMFRV